MQVALVLQHDTLVRASQWVTNWTYRVVIVVLLVIVMAHLA
jgi:hypothetical protein